MHLLEAKQFTPIYDPREDRIRLIININTPTRYDMWLTRAMLIKILDRVEEFVAADDVYTVPETDGEEGSVEAKVFAPINDTPLLLEQFSLTKQSDGTFLLRISDGQKEFGALLQSHQLQQLLHLLKSQVRFVWGIV